MWCKRCNLETNETVCPVCGSETVEDIPVEIYWCENCCIPIEKLDTWLLILDLFSQRRGFCLLYS